MVSLNRVTLIGNVGNDGDLKFTKNNTAVLTFSIATSESWKDSSGDTHEQTYWHNIIVWGKYGESMAKYITKGKQVYVEGKLTNRSWEGNNGEKKYRSEIVSSFLILLGRRSGGDNGPPEYSDNDYISSRQQKTSEPQTRAPSWDNNPPTQYDSGPISDDDLPF